MSQTQQQITVQVSKLINAPVERVFKAWTDPDQFGKWLGGNLSTGAQVQADVRTDGQYRIDMPGCENKAGKITGTYKEIVPNKKLVFTWTNNSEEYPATDTLVTVEFIATGNGTEVTIKHTNFLAQATAERHNMGWTASLEKLADLIA